MNHRHWLEITKNRVCVLFEHVLASNLFSCLPFFRIFFNFFPFFLPLRRKTVEKSRTFTADSAPRFLDSFFFLSLKPRCLPTTDGASMGNAASLWGEVSRIGKIIAKGVAFCIWTIQVYAYMYTYMCTYMFDFHRMNGSQSYENIPVPWILWGWNLWVMFLNQRCGEEIISPWVLVSIIFYVQRRSLGRSFYGMPQKPGSDEWWNLIRQGKT